MYRVVGLVLCRDMESQLFDIPQGNSSTSFCSASWFSHVISWSVNILVQQFNLKKVGMGIYGTKSSCKQKHCWPFVPRWHWIDRSILSLNTIRRSVERTTNLIVHNCIHFGSLFVREALEILLLSHSLCPLTTHITDSFTNQFIYGLLS